MTDGKGSGGVVNFFTTTLWELDPEEYSGARRLALKYLQIMALVVKDFWEDQCLLRASALTFSTILSIVPFFALTFALLKGLGVQNKLEPLILDQVAAGSQEVVTKIVSYINNTNMTSLGAIGLATLIITVITLLGNIEEAFNAIWGVSETRSFHRKFSDYISVIVTGPLLLVAATSVTTTLQSQTMVKWLVENSYLGDLILHAFRLIPYLSIWIALVFLYIFIPNTKVRLKSAIIGGILAGTSWQIAQWGYIHFQVGVAKYNAIYGTLAMLPIFMVWIYTSWLIVLFGVEVVYAHQNIKTFRREVHTPSLSHGMKELLALSLLHRIAVEFHAGRPPLTEEGLAEELDLPIRVVRELLHQLCDAGYLVAVADESAFQPARSLEQLSVVEILATLRTYGEKLRLTRMTRGEELLQALLAKKEAGAAATLAGVTFRDLLASDNENSANGNSRR
jgi:membrane protein